MNTAKVKNGYNNWYRYTVPSAGVHGIKDEDTVEVDGDAFFVPKYDCIFCNVLSIPRGYGAGIPIKYLEDFRDDNADQS